MASHWFSKKISKYYLKKKGGDAVEFEESVAFANSGTEKVSINEAKINRHSATTALLAIGFIFILLAQTFKLQILDRSKFSVLAENNRQKEIAFRADRGIIYDKSMNVLVKNEAIFDLVGIGRYIPEDKNALGDLISKIASITGRKTGEIENAIKKLDRASYRPELIVDNIGVAAAIMVETERDGLPGIEARKNAIRSYPDAKYFSQIIGYTGRVGPADLKADSSYEQSDFIGKDGLESYYESYLRGEKGVEKSEVDAGGKVISVLSKTDAQSGKNLILSIDGDLQKKLQDALEAQLDKIRGLSRSNGAVAIALDPRNGKILALVSLPTYDSNKFVNPEGKPDRDAILDDPDSPMLNRAIGGLYAPGSTIKPLMSIAALSEGIINENTIIEDLGVIDVYYRNLVTHFYGWNRGGLGPMNVISAIAKSSDIFFYTVGGGFGKIAGLGVDKISKYFNKFNLGKKMGIDLPGEADGLVPTKEWKEAKYGEDWNLGNTYHLSIGQGYLLVTPLQVASWTEVMANGGTLHRPLLVDKITSGDSNETLKEIKPETISANMADKKYIDIVRRGMREVVLNGTAGSLKDVGVPVAGKTGTAQFLSKGKEMTHSWFTSFAPYDNPEIVLTVLIEGGGEGSSTAVPIAKEILSWYFRERKSGSLSAN